MSVSSGRGRVSAPEYWLYFAIYMMLSIGSLASIFYFGAQLRIAIAIFSWFLLVVSGLGFRVIEMWRCRDIGWPASLPWLLFGAQMLIGVFAGATGMNWSAVLAISAMMGVIDFGFAIAIGCVATKSWGETVYTPIDYSGFTGNDGLRVSSELNDVAMARLAQAAAPKSAAIATISSVEATPRPAGFGRKGL